MVFFQPGTNNCKEELYLVWKKKYKTLAPLLAQNCPGSDTYRSAVKATFLRHLYHLQNLQVSGLVTD